MLMMGVVTCIAEGTADDLICQICFTFLSVKLIVWFSLQCWPHCWGTCVAALRVDMAFCHKQTLPLLPQAALSRHFLRLFISCPRLTELLAQGMLVTVL